MFLRAFIYLALGASFLLIFNPHGSGKAETESEFSLSRWFGCKAYWFVNPYQIDFWDREFEMAYSDPHYFGKLFVCGREVLIRWYPPFSHTGAATSPWFNFPKGCKGLTMNAIPGLEPLTVWQDGKQVIYIEPGKQFYIYGARGHGTLFTCSPTPLPRPLTYADKVEIPTGLYMFVKTRYGKDMTIFNVYTRAKKITKDGDAILVETKGYRISYFPRDTSFLILLYGKDPVGQRRFAEATFDNYLGFSHTSNERCLLKVSQYVSKDHPEYAGIDYGLAQCLGGKGLYYKR